MRTDADITLPDAKAFLALATLGLALAAGAGIWAFQASVRALRVEAREQARTLTVRTAESAPVSRASPAATNVAAVDHAINRVLKVMDTWATRLTFATAATGAGMLVTLLVGVGWWRQAWANRVFRQYQASDDQARRLQEAQQAIRRHLATQQRLQSELAALQAETEQRVQERTAESTKRYAVLEKELNERRLAEKNLSYQRQELVRSKDVLELHVQVRAREMEKLQRRYEYILNSAGEGIYGLDLQGKTTFVNPTAAKLTGWTVEELAGKLEGEVFCCATDAAAAEAAAQSLSLPLANEQTFTRRDGTTFPVEYVRTPILENQKAVGAVVIFRDITERRRGEESLARKAAELSRSNAELEQFAYVASHDLQEPLRKIQAFGDRLRATVEAAKLDNGRDYLDRMQNAAARMQRLIADLLTFSRVISSAQPFVPVDLNVITLEVLNDLEVAIERSQAEITVDPLPTLDADPLQMRQLLQNLLSNSLKFQPPNAVPVVQVQAQVLKRPFSCVKDPTPDDEVCELTVQDNGIGFDEKYLDKVFAVFQRLHGRTEYEGTGVGLAVCRRITDRHGGTITARSKPGEGATFIVTLPLRQPNGDNAK